MDKIPVHLTSIAEVQAYKSVLPLPYHFVRVIDKDRMTLFENYFAVRSIQNKRVDKMSLYKPISKLLDYGH